MIHPLLHLPTILPSYHTTYAHALHAQTTPPPSPTTKPASPWSIRTSSKTPPHVPHGSTQPPTNSGASHKVSQTTESTPPTQYFSFPLTKSPETNDPHMPDLSAATVPRKLNLTAPASRWGATSLTTMATSA